MLPFVANPRQFYRNALLGGAGLAIAAALVLGFLRMRKHSRRPAIGQESIQRIDEAVRSSWLPTCSLFDHVSLYQRNGFVENYGLDFRERRSKPIRVERTILQLTEGNAWLLWWPDHAPVPPEATLLEIAFADSVPIQGTLTVGFLLKTGGVVHFEHRFGPGSPVATPSPYMPPEFLTALARAGRPLALARHEHRLLAHLPADFLFSLQEHGDKAILAWFIGIAGVPNSDVAFDHVSLMRPGKTVNPNTGVHLQGIVQGAGIQDEITVELARENGERTRQPLAPDGSFRFENVPGNEPVSLHAAYLHQDYFVTLGRWFIPARDRDDLVIDLMPLYQNPDKHPSDTKTASTHGDVDSPIAGMYKAHTRQKWPGNCRVQEYEGLSFANNIGHLDRDRFFDNPDQCFRVVHLGSSHAVSCQLRPSDKYNLYMEAELGIRLGRPVEVISLGRDNGDLGANFSRARALAARFNPDVILLEHGSALMLQLHPELLRRKLGWDQAHCALDSFHYQKDGTLAFRPWSRDWPLHVLKADGSELSPGIPFVETLRVPFEHMHPLGRDSFPYMTDIVKYYRQTFPQQKIVLHTGLDQAQAHGQYERKATLPNGTTLKMGPAVFLANLEEHCRQQGIPCIHPAPPLGYNDKPETYLTFVEDGHFSPRGQQWLAKELATGLIQVLGLKK